MNPPDRLLLCSRGVAQLPRSERSRSPRHREQPPAQPVLQGTLTSGVPNPSKIPSPGRLLQCGRGETQQPKSQPFPAVLEYKEPLIPPPDKVLLRSRELAKAPRQERSRTPRSLDWRLRPRNVRPAKTVCKWSCRPMTRTPARSRWDIASVAPEITGAPR